MVQLAASKQCQRGRRLRAERLQQKAKEVNGQKTFNKRLNVEQESNTGGKKDCSKSNVSRYLVTVFFFTYCNKILFTSKNLSLFKQGTMSTVIT